MFAAGGQRARDVYGGVYGPRGVGRVAAAPDAVTGEPTRR